VYHWIARSVGQNALFRQEADYVSFLWYAQKYCGQYKIAVFHYCIMSDHAHLLIQAANLEALIKFSYYTLRMYAYYYGRTHAIPGQVFRRMYRSIPVDRDEYLLECGRYIERNPVNAGLAKLPEKYPYSSYRYYAKGEADPIISPSPAFMGLSELEAERRRQYVQYVEQERSIDALIAGPFARI